MDGCRGGNNERKFVVSVASAAMAMYSLKMAISELKEDSIFYNI
jgi:formyltetrahydrofolate synthetase